MRSSTLFIFVVGLCMMTFVSAQPCSKVTVCQIDYMCGTTDSVCPEDFGVDCSSAGCCDTDCGTCAGQAPESSKGVIPEEFGDPFYADINPMSYTSESSYGSLLNPSNCLSTLQLGETCNQTWTVHVNSSATLGNYTFFAIYTSEEHNNVTAFFNVTIG